MRSLFTICIVFILNFSFAQTKDETQGWIENKIEEFPYVKSGVINNYSVSFVNGNMNLIKNLIMDVGGIKSDVSTTYSVPIKEISLVKFEVKENNVWLTIRTNNGVKNISSKVDFETKTDYLNEFTIMLSSDFKSNDMVNRAKKAFNHLIVLYGGKVQKEVF